jgi:glyoxylase-like metal-dependent hydrolase (beta-lactamase superfamily II)
VIEIQTFEEITQIRMSRETGGKPAYWVASYFVDGLLIDTGCSYTAGELMSFLEKHAPKWVVNTHYHEDHIGANCPIQDRFGIDVFAHPESVPRIGRPST